MYLLGIDVGTSGCKINVFTLEGNIVSSASREYSEYSPKPGWTELNPDEVWNALKASIKEGVSRTPSDEIKALSFSTLGSEVMVPVDKKGKWVYPAISGYDARGEGYQDQLKMWNETLGALRIFQITGMPMQYNVAANKILWLRENMPKVFNKTCKFVSFQDYLVWKLTGNFAIDYSMASRMMLMDIHKKAWSAEMLNIANISEDMLSDPCPSGVVVGEVSAEVAEEIGLSGGTAVVSGGHDQACGALGVGVINEGPAMDATGSVECIAAAMEKPVLTEDMLESKQCCYCHAVEDMYLTLGFLPSAGLVLRWFRDTFAEKEKEEAGKSARNVYDILTEEASASPPGSSNLFLLPHFLGSGTGRSPALYAKSRGALIGLSIFHTRGDVIRSILEGITFEIRQIISLLEHTGIRVSELRSVGGGAKSSFWLQLKADMVNKRVIVPVITEAASLGAAILAGIGVEVFKDFKSAVREVFREQSVYEPRMENVKLYDRQYQIYEMIYPTLVRIFEKIFDL